MAYSAPTTKSTGTLITAAIWNQDVVDNQNAAFPLGVGAWTSYTPTLTQGATLSKTIGYAKYQRIGRTIFVQLFLTITSAGTPGSAIEVGLPVAAAAGGGPTGSYRYLDSGVGIYTGACYGISTVVLRLAVAGADNLGANPAVTAANNDTLLCGVTYEAAS